MAHVPCYVLGQGQEEVIPDQGGSTMVCLEGDSVSGGVGGGWVGISCPLPIQVPIVSCWHRGCNLWGLPSTIRMLYCGKGRLTSHSLLGPVVSFYTGEHTNYVAGPVSMISHLPLCIIKFID